VLFRSPVPSLFSFAIEDPRLTGLAGVSVAQASVEINELHRQQFGPVLVTHWGLSGPAILKLSSWAARELNEASYHAELIVNWLPEDNPETMYAGLAEVKNDLAQKQISRHAVGGLPQRLWQRIVEHSGIADGITWREASKSDLHSLAYEICRGRFTIQGKGAFKDEFVTCGGVDLDEVDMKSMQSRLVKGLFFAGEVLDIDGLTGGYNLQSAWTTGWLAGQALCK
jgi:predicted Rossmann fold flavoprotein